MLMFKFRSLFVFVICLLFIERCSAQAKTDPKEVKAINTILDRWGKPASSAWNISGDPCTGAAVDTTDFDTTAINPIIKCDCTINNNATCHITKLKVYALDVVGTIPEELVDLPFLSNLGMGTNNFSGSLPPEFGNLINLQQLYMDSSGLSGELPSTLSKLKNIETLWASDNDFTGKIPKFVGNWPNLKSLRLQGNSFMGPIPSSFLNLTKMNDLRIGDIVNGTSSLTFINKMTSLNILILRNTKISDSIPSNFAPFNNLMKLDLSFNNITGFLPQSLFNLSSLKYLYLGNNSISGSLPILKSSSLANVDLSYNQLSGSFPSWVSEPNLQLNLVANNFVIDGSNSSVLPSGLNCLQRNVPCNHGSPIYSNFAIDCGGYKVIKDSNGIEYDIDNANVSTASYFVTDPNKWGVSSVGSFAEDTTGSNYLIYSSSQFLNTLDSELFQTARMSPSSLRYYGLGLENGNYSIELQFSETAFLNSQTWKSTGKRVFDIFIQGNLAEKDFDIRKAAGGESFRVVVKKYIAPVTNNFLEIHFFWAGKGTCCVPTQGYYGPSISAIRVSPSDFTPTVSNKPPSSSKSKNTGLIAGIAVAIGISGFLAALGFFIFKQKQRKRRLSDEKELSGMTNRPDTFSYAELKNATNDFNAAHLLGEGGFGAVHKGQLSDGRLVAVKQLSVASNQGKRQFMAEIGTISAVQHRNLVKLYGCCIEGDKRLVVYEYLENKSLDQAIFGKSNLLLNWLTRFEVCLGAARGLAYLHEESTVRIVHRDIKASNILLDTNLNPKISDFGLAKLYDDKKTHISTRVAGTIGYLAPEYAMRGHLTEKADVFGFGVVVLEVISGRPNADMTLDEEKIYLLEWAWRLHESNCDIELVDPKLSSFNEKEAIRLIGVALLCTQASPMLRPYMSRVVAMLTGDIEVAEVTTRPGYLTEYHLKDLSSDFKSCEFSSASASTSTSTSIYSQNSEDLLSPSQPLVSIGEVSLV